MAANHFSSGDDFITTCFDNNMITSGRWSQKYFSIFSTLYNLPWVHFSIVFIAVLICNILIIKYLALKGKVTIAITAFLLCVFPSLTSYITYLYNADAYCIAMVLGCLAVIISAKYSYGWIGGAMLLAASVGIYQSNLAYAMTFASVWLINQVVENQSKEKIIKNIVRFALMIILGTILYFIALNILLTLQNVQLSDYKGVNKMGTFNITEIGSYLKNGLKTLIFFFFTNKGTVSLYNSSNIQMLYALLFLIIAVMCVLIIVDLIMKKNYIAILLFIFSGMAMFVSLTAMEITASYTEHNLMEKIHFAFIFLIPLILAKYTFNVLKVKENFRIILYWVISINLLFIGVHYYYLDNLAFYNVELRQQQHISTLIKLSDRIEECESYEIGKNVAIIGELSESYYNARFAKELKGFTGTNQVVMFYSQDYFNLAMDQYVNRLFVMADPNTVDDIANTYEFSEMSYWPESGSVSCINDVVVVKLSE